MTMRIVILAFIIFGLAACSGSSGSSSPPAPANHNVTLSWLANHETGVNSAGGGYTVSISGQSAPPAISVPFVSGAAAAPTTTTTLLYTGSYTATITAHAALDLSGGGTGTISLASSAVSITVP